MLSLPITADALPSSPFPALNVCHNSNKHLLGESKNVAEIPACAKQNFINDTDSRHMHTHTCTLASYPGLLTKALVTCSANAGEVLQLTTARVRRPGYTRLHTYLVTSSRLKSYVCLHQGIRSSRMRLRNWWLNLHRCNSLRPRSSEALRQFHTVSVYFASYLYPFCFMNAVRLGLKRRSASTTDCFCAPVSAGYVRSDDGSDRASTNCSRCS